MQGVTFVASETGRWSAVAGDGAAAAINGQKLEPGLRYLLGDGQILQLADGAELVVSPRETPPLSLLPPSFSFARRSQPRRAPRAARASSTPRERRARSRRRGAQVRDDTQYSQDPMLRAMFDAFAGQAEAQQAAAEELEDLE